MSWRWKTVWHTGMHTAFVESQVTIAVVTELVVAVGETEVVEVDDAEAVGRGAVELLAVDDAGWPFVPAVPPTWLGLVVYAKAVVKPPSNSSSAAAVMICVFVAWRFIYLRRWVRGQSDLLQSFQELEFQKLLQAPWVVLEAPGVGFEPTTPFGDRLASMEVSRLTLTPICALPGFPSETLGDPGKQTHRYRLFKSVNLVRLLRSLLRGRRCLLPRVCLSSGSSRASGRCPTPL